MSSLTVSERAPLTDPLAGNIHDVILIEDLGVRYRLPNIRTRSFKNFMIQTMRGQVHYEYFWALKHITMRVRDGEILGLIGHNGAGKTTLLKAVARIIKPREGRLVVKGSVAALLGVGAGFHQELTGRENVYLNGTLLGFSKKQMDEKFERIVDFAELWDYIDQPLRTYSSGMRARLGFAVATDSRPDILIVDEILSVGDEAFRAKSSERMQEFRDQGATVLLVTHNLNTVREICHRVAWIHQGELRRIGEAGPIVDEYMEERRQHVEKKNPRQRA